MLTNGIMHFIYLTRATLFDATTSFEGLLGKKIQRYTVLWKRVQAMFARVLR